jgi:cellulose synthase/poly-beta-1,6-N-acetylglucosamine synthase-like glycosyltransferase
LTAEWLPDVWWVIGALAACVTLPGSLELLILSVAALVSLSRTSVADRGRSTGWRAAVVVPAHNEEANIAACVESLLAAERGGIEVDVYVVADNCVDKTARIAADAGARVMTRMNDVERGKGYALNFAFTELQTLGYGGVLVVDADSVVAANFIIAAAGALRDGADAVQTRYLVLNLHQNMRTRLMGLALRGFNVVRPLGREYLGLSVGILGNGFGLSSETLRAVPYQAASVVEDLEYHLSLVQAGLRVSFIDGTTVFGEIPVAGSGVETQRSRWEGGRLRMIYLTTPKLLRGVLSGRLILLEPLFELLLLPLSFHVALLAIAVSTPLMVVRYAGIAGLGVVLIHLVAASVIGGGGWRDLGTLAMAPFYVVWKLMLIPAVLRNARSNHAWVRTRRNAEPQLPGEARSSDPL